jgi:dTMP kinase
VAGRGRFITFEGGEGAGKTTQIRQLAARLQPLVGDVVLTREPGGSPGAEALRDLLVRGETDRWSPQSETLILYAAREDHLERTIRPALEAGRWVLSDRFADSTRAYQGAGGGAAAGFIAGLEAAVVGDTRPDLTLILDLPVEQGLARAAHRGGGEERFERKGRAFHERLRQGFLAIAEAEPERCVVIDAARAPEEVSLGVWAAVRRRLAPGDG